MRKRMRTCALHLCVVYVCMRMCIMSVCLYMRLCMSVGNADIANSVALKLASQVDPTGMVCAYVYVFVCVSCVCGCHPTCIDTYLCHSLSLCLFLLSLFVCR